MEEEKGGLYPPMKHYRASPFPKGLLLASVNAHMLKNIYYINLFIMSNFYTAHSLQVGLRTVYNINFWAERKSSFLVQHTDFINSLVLKA